VDVTDAHRLLGPLPFDDVPSATPAGLLVELDRLAVRAAYVTHTRSLFADPAGGNEILFAQTRGQDRLHPVPVVIPGWVPSTVDELAGWRADGVRMVRLCPSRHRFDLAGPVAARWLTGIAAAGLVMVIDLDETTPAALRAVAAQHPALAVLLVNPGFRRLRELAELLGAAPRLYVETGTLNTQGGVEWLAAQGGADRLVFGTGAPVLDDGGPRFQLDHLDLPSETVARIASGALEELTR
jgi:predicted TIM-barrel fold metal-dependent hydrolase